MSPAPGVTVRVQTAGGESFVGVCAGLDLRKEEADALVEFEAAGAPAIRIGRVVHLGFRTSEETASIEATGEAILRTDKGDRRCYSFRLERVPPALLALFANRRASDRVRPPASSPVRIRFLDLGESDVADVVVHDISATGISVLVEPALEERLCGHTRVELSILLPGSEPVAASATIRHRRLLDSAVLYGLEFNGQIPEFMQAQERLLSYIGSLRSKRP